MVELLVPLAILFIVAGGFLILANQLSIPAIPVYIIVGLLISPFIEEGTTLELAQWGIAFLVFTFGIDIEPHRFRSVAHESTHISAVQVLLVGGLTYGVGLLLGVEPLNALYFSSAAALSSSLVGRELSVNEIRQNLVHSRLISSIHFIQDLLAVVLLLVLSAAAFTPDGIALKLGYGVMILLAAVLVRVYLFDLLIRLSGDSDELIILTGIGILVGFISLAELVNVSIAVGAFAAGLAIARDFSNNLALLTGLESFEDFFATIFFVTVGSLVAIPSARAALLAIALFGAIVILKPLITTALLLWEGYEPRTAVLTSSGLDQVSEFALIIVIQALILERIQPAVFEAIALVAAATMVTSTLTRQYEEELYQFLSRLLPLRSFRQQRDDRSSVESTLQDHVIVVGYGRLGTIIAETCREQGMPVLVVEHDPEQLQLVKENYDQYVFGDAMSETTWRRATVKTARLVISTVPQRRLSERILAIDTEADVILRAADTNEAVSLLDGGADYVIVSDYLASERLLEKIRQVLSDDISSEEFRQQNERTLPSKID